MKMKLSVGILAALTVLFLPQPGLAQRQPDPNAMFERLDQNRDGVLTQDELPEQRQDFFDLMLQRGDTDQDGRLTQEEFTASLSDASGRPQFGGRPQRGRGGGQARPMRRQGMAPGGPGERAERMFEELDSNGDGRVTKEEVPDRMEQFLERFDRDGDGMVTEDEVSGQPFQGSGPAVGQSLPDLRVYDAQGREFQLSSLKGNYSVLVFGCLT
jgi:collagen type III alpha